MAVLRKRIPQKRILFIAKPHEKVHINAWKKSTKRIDLKTEDGKQKMRMADSNRYNNSSSW